MHTNTVKLVVKLIKISVGGYTLIFGHISGFKRKYEATSPGLTQLRV